MDPNDVPARLVASGRVLAVNEGINTFTMTVAQTIDQAGPPRQLSIQGIMSFNLGWQDAMVQLSAPNSSIAFSGDILAFRGGDVIVNVANVSHLPAHFVLPAAPPALPANDNVPQLF